MKRLTYFTALLMLVAIFVAQTASAQSTLRRAYDDLEVDIWTDKDDGSNYLEGDEITIYFRASRDAYVTIYDLDTRGNVNLLFPADPRDNNYIEGDVVYVIPDRGDDYALTLEGPPGWERIQIVASAYPYDVPDWRGPRPVKDDDYWDDDYDGDDDRFIEKINRRYFPNDRVAYDQVSFYVAPRYYYKPERADCYGDCGTVYIDYPSGCEVYVNGVFWGYAPLYIPSIYLGRHRVTVYWGASIVYNDWIFVDTWSPFFIYPRHYYIYDYCWDRWYRHGYWDDWYGFDGPSRYKYKDHDVYTYKKPSERRGYAIVSNDHGKYEKSKTYVVEKTARIDKYKTKYGFDQSTKSFTTAKGVGKGSKSGDYNTSTSGKRKSGIDDFYEKKSEPRSTDKKGTSSGSQSGDYGRSKTKSSGESGSSINKKPRESSGESKGKATPAVKQPSKKSGGSDGGSKSSGGSVNKPSSSGNKSSGGNSGGSKSGGNSGGSKSSGDSGSKGKKR